MKKIVLSLSIIGAVAAMAIGATRAYFSDVETSQGNTFTAGTLDLKVDNNDLSASSTLITIGNVKPGDTGSDTGTFSNAGSIGGTLSLAIDNITSNENGQNTPEITAETAMTGGNTPNAGELCAKMNVKIEMEESNNWVSKYYGPITATTTQLGALAATSTNAYRVSYDIPLETVGNEIQSDICSFGLTATLKQQ